MKPRHPPYIGLAQRRSIIANCRATQVMGWLLSFLLLALAGCSRSDSPTPELFIISPHSSDIRREFQTAFSNWHQEHYHTPVKIQWPGLGAGGTGDIVKTLDAQYAAGPTGYYDLVFGGGTASFDDFATRNYLAAPPLAPEVLNQVPPEIFGRSLHGRDNLWIAATMSSFGICANKDRMAELQLVTPRTWEDLTQPQWFGQLSLADPSKSGSVRTCYDMVLQQYGWQRGWADLVLLFANAEVIREGGSHPADDAASAQAVAGIVIDFYGRNQIARVGQKIVTFIIPEGGSTLDPDPIAMLRGAPHPELAAHFIEFVISPAGQKIWTFRPHTPGGPQRNALGRLSVLPSLYATGAASMTDPSNPFTSADPLTAEPATAKIRAIFLGDLLKSSLIDNHAALTAARKAIHNAGDPPELLARLAATPSLPAMAGTVPTTASALPTPITDKNLKDVAQAFKPADKAQLERNQSLLKTHWQSDFAARLKSIQRDAESRPKL